ncbi:hypothetical protein, partial [Dysgonomonas reticulitermitis]
YKHGANIALFEACDTHFGVAISANNCVCESYKFVKMKVSKSGAKTASPDFLWAVGWVITIVIMSIIGQR